MVNWRNIGDVPYDTWHKAITAYGGPSGLASQAAWQAARPHTALGLGQLFVESKYGVAWDKNDPDSYNALNMKKPKGGGYVRFGSWAEGMGAWKARIADPDYKNGVYAETGTLEEYIHAFAPDDDGNDEAAYCADIRRLWKTWGIKEQDNVTTPSTPEEPVEEEPPLASPASPESIKPDFISAPVTKRADGQGFNYGTRGPIDGLVIHERQGRLGYPGNRQFFSCVTSTSCRDYGICEDGERCENALVDWEITRDGMLYEYQDPYDTNRIPWASGGPEQNGNPIGRAINAKYRGVFGGVNKVYAAVEVEKTDDEPMTPAQIQTAGKLLAYVMAKRGYPANDWRYPDVLGGNIYTAPHHNDISQTSCRIGDSDKAAIEAVCDRELAAFYAGVTPGEPETPTTPPPPVDIIPGVDLAVAKRLFGIAKGEDGRSYSYDPNGPVSTLWTERGKAEGEWPALAAVYSYESGARRYFVFEGGATVIAVKGQAPRWLKEAA